MTDVFDEALATIKRAVLAIEQEVRRLSGPLESAEARLSALNAAARDQAAHIAADQKTVEQAKLARQQADEAEETAYHAGAA
jgi:hypothetical protein